MLFSKNDYWTESDTKKREKIVSKVQREHDSEKLVRIAIEAPITGVSNAAIQKIQSYDDLLKVFDKRRSCASEIASVLPDDFSRIRFIQEAPFENKVSAENVINCIQDMQLLYEAVCSGAHFGSEYATHAILMYITDRDILKKMSIGGEEKIQRLAKEKLEDMEALDAIVRNKDNSIQTRFEAAKKLEDKYGDLGPKRELQKLGTPGPNFHILYRTIYNEWKQIEYICLRCGKIGGREDDSESTSHYGCNFEKEVCQGK